MNFILFDGEERGSTLPFTYTRPVCELRVGILTIREKWEFFLKSKTSTLTADYLQIKYPIYTAAGTTSSEYILINGAVCPCEELINEIKNLAPGNVLVKGKTVVACRHNGKSVEDIYKSGFSGCEKVNVKSEFMMVRNLWDIFSFNSEQLKSDFQFFSKGRKSQPTGDSVKTQNNAMIFIEEGAIVEHCFLNAKEGPIYIGKRAEVMEGCMIRGPLALCEGAVLKMGAKIYGATTIGPYSKVGGEVNNSVFIGNSNKAHDGFLGNSVIGEWCNIGADTNNSNLKNNYGSVKVWDFLSETFKDSGLQFCGIFMGDHSKCGINSMFNTGTVVGVCANIFGTGFPDKFIPSFSWGGVGAWTVYRLEKALEVAKQVMLRRGKKLDEVEQSILTEVFRIET